MNRKGGGMYPPKIPLAAAAVQGCITVENLFPEAAYGNSDPVILSDHRCKVADEKQLLLGIPAATG